jgi:hypothetical protein
MEWGGVAAGRLLCYSEPVMVPFGWESCHSTVAEHGHDGIEHTFIFGAWTRNWCADDKALVPAVSGRLGHCTCGNCWAEPTASVDPRECPRMAYSQISAVSGECCHGRLKGIISRVDS